MVMVAPTHSRCGATVPASRPSVAASHTIRIELTASLCVGMPTHRPMATTRRSPTKSACRRLEIMLPALPQNLAHNAPTKTARRRLEIAPPMHFTGRWC